jgi:AmiR/NasT family two-component response regulator
MERYSLDEHAAFDMLRDRSRSSGEKLLAISQALLDSHSLLREPARSPAE